LRAGERVPKTAVTVAVSLDGVMVPMKDGERLAKRQRAATAEKHRAIGAPGSWLRDAEFL